MVIKNQFWIFVKKCLDTIIITGYWIIILSKFYKIRILFFNYNFVSLLLLVYIIKKYFVF
jgi:hypothetical protein